MPRPRKSIDEPPACPLTPQRCDECREALLALRRLEERFRDAEAAGLDVSRERQLRDEIMQAIVQLLRVYAPQSLQGLE